MGLFDFLKKKAAPTAASPQDTGSTPRPQMSENKLETLLRKASGEPAYRPAFYESLLSEDLVVMTDQNRGEGDTVLEEDTSIGIVTFKGGDIPVFTSPERILDNRVIDHNVPFVKLNGKVLLETTRGAKLVLNPYSDYAKELLPDEIEDLLNGTIVSGSQKTVVTEKETRVLLAQPKDYPNEMVASLNIVFRNHPTVNKAYLALMSDGSEKTPGLVIAVDADTDDFQSIVNEAGFTAQQYLKIGKYEVVNFLKIGGGSLDSYFIEQTEPFYTR